VGLLLLEKSRCALRLALFVEAQAIGVAVAAAAVGDVVARGARQIVAHIARRMAVRVLPKIG
jgi:hypothetical protein